VDITNPNGWPFSGSISDAAADIKSVDGSGSGKLPVGTGELPDSLHIGTNSNVTFNLTVTTEPMAQDSPLFQRLISDCGPGSSHQTQLDITVTGAKVHVFWAHVTLPDVDIGVVPVPCDFNVPPQIEVPETPGVVLV